MNVLCCVCMYILFAVCMYMCVVCVVWVHRYVLCIVLCGRLRLWGGGMRERLPICSLGVHMCIEKTKENCVMFIKGLEK